MFQNQKHNPSQAAGYPMQSRLSRLDSQMISVDLGKKSIFEEYNDAKRKQIFAKDFHLAKIIGCTCAKIAPTESGVEPVLDAAGGRFIFDNDTVRVGAAFAVADGLGHSPFEEENNETASVAKNAVQELSDTWIQDTVGNTPESLLTLLQSIAQSSKQEVKKGNQALRNTSLAGTKLVLKENNYTATCCNVGDAMHLIYRCATEELIVIPAVHYDKLYNPKSNPTLQFAPEDIANTSLETFQCREIPALQANDIIITMTDGYWEEFNVSLSLPIKFGNHPKKPGYEIIKRETQIEEESFKALLKQVAIKHSHPSALDYAEAIHQQALETLITKRQQLLAFRKNFLSLVLTETNMQLTIQQFMDSTLIEQQFLQQFNAFIESTQYGDGAAIDRATTQIQDVHCLLTEKLSCGDDASLMVLIVPDPKVELVRCVVENKGMVTPQLRQRIEKTINEDEFELIGKKLFQQQLHDYTQYNLEEIKDALRAFNEATLTKAKLPNDGSKEKCNIM